MNRLQNSPCLFVVQECDKSPEAKEERGFKQRMRLGRDAKSFSFLSPHSLVRKKIARGYLEKLTVLQSN